MSLDKSLFLLDPEIIFLNHGSFGATPRPVFDIYQSWQRKLEYQPVKFLGREFNNHMAHSRQALASYFKADVDELVYIPNATFGVNAVARSIQFQPGDEILTTDHEYGACDRTWQFICQKSGAHYIKQAIPLPAAPADQIVDLIWEGVTKHTRLIFLSHITSPTALRMPVEAICDRAKNAGILTLIDGAHAPGQIPVDLHTINADFYTGNCHKWMLSPKGVGFLYASRSIQSLLEPLIVSWGYQAEPQFTTGNTFVDYFQWCGTHDPAAALSVPAAIQFQETFGWPQIRNQCHDLLTNLLLKINELTGLAELYSEKGDLNYQMGVAALPYIADLQNFKNQLYDKFHVEVPCIQWHDWQLLRISVQGYNTWEDLEQLIFALRILLPKHT